MSPYFVKDKFQSWTDSENINGERKPCSTRLIGFYASHLDSRKKNPLSACTDPDKKGEDSDEDPKAPKRNGGGRKRDRGAEKGGKSNKATEQKGKKGDKEAGKEANRTRPLNGGDNKREREIKRPEKEANRTRPLNGGDNKRERREIKRPEKGGKSNKAAERRRQQKGKKGDKESKKEVKNEVGRKRNRQNANRRKNRNKKVHGNGNNNNAKQTGNSSQKDGKKTMKEGDTKQHNKAPKNLKPGKPNASIAARKDGDGKRQKECKLRNKCKKASGQCKKEDCVNSVKNGCGKKSGCTCCLKDNKCLDSYAKEKCTTKGGKAVLIEECDGKRKDNLVYGAQCTCCIPCKTKKSCTRRGGECKKECKNGEVDKGKCGGKDCKCCLKESANEDHFSYQALLGFVRHNLARRADDSQSELRE
nr:axoneme-associated protein mst101(2)-like [Penaeus vannamei]